MHPAVHGGLLALRDNGITLVSEADAGGSGPGSCVVVDPANPDTVWLGTGENLSQRSAHFGSGLFKSTDAGETWKEMTNGLPEGDKGRIGLAVSPADPDVVYAIVEAAEEGGFYRSRDAGVNWKKIKKRYEELLPYLTTRDDLNYVIGEMIAELNVGHAYLFSGPRGTGKTTTAKRLSVQLMVNGIRPVALGMDDYYVDRDQTPKHPDGSYDFGGITITNDFLHASPALDELYYRIRALRP